MSKNIKNWPVMAKMCSTCPFKEGPNQDHKLVNSIKSRALKVSQICHHPRLKGKEETHLCRGSRDFQLEILYKMGELEEPTDEEFERKSRFYANRSNET
jgi:hypothetical protein